MGVRIATEELKADRRQRSQRYLQDFVWEKDTKDLRTPVAQTTDSRWLL